MSDDRHLPWLARRAQRWAAHRTFGEPGLDVGAAVRARGMTVAVVLPAMNEEPTIGGICRAIARDLDWVDELIVIDGDSTDGTAGAARAAGATVVDARAVLPSFERVAGKGDSMWRSLAATSSDVVVWIDADIRNFSSDFVSRLVAPLLDDDVSFVKAFYRRPIDHGAGLQEKGGGRVTELLARPLLDALFPELGGVRQPLAGEYAGRREVLERLPFFTGYSVEVGLLIDLLDLVGLDGMAQADLGARVHRNRPLDELVPMAHAIARTILRRARERGRIDAYDYDGMPALSGAGGGLEPAGVAERERPPIAGLREGETAVAT